MRKRLNFILDLDETLIHCNDDSDEKCDVKLQICYESGEIMDVKYNYEN